MIFVCTKKYIFWNTIEKFTVFFRHTCHFRSNMHKIPPTCCSRLEFVFVVFTYYQSLILLGSCKRWFFIFIFSVSLQTMNRINSSILVRIIIAIMYSFFRGQLYQYMIWVVGFSDVFVLISLEEHFWKIEIEFKI